MNQREADDVQPRAAEAPEAEQRSTHERTPKRDDNFVGAMAKSRLTRVSGAGLSGLQASASAFVIGGCIFLGYLAGNWVDTRYSTTIWMPIGVMVGVAAGFAEMFRTLKQLTRQTKRDAERFKTGQQHEKAYTSPTSVGSQSPQVDLKVNSGVTRERIFKVPPPPLPGMEQQPVEPVAETVTTNEEDKTPDEVELDELELGELARRLLQSERDDRPSSSQ